MDPSQKWFCLEIEDRLCFEYRTNVCVPSWCFKPIGSLMISLIIDPWTSQVLCATCEDFFFMRQVDVWLYNKFVHPWHVGEFINPCANPHAMRPLFLFVFLMVLLGLDSRTNPF